MKKATHENIEWYRTLFDTYEASLNGSSGTAVHKIRTSAFNRLEEIGFPTRKNEEWKYTDISPVIKEKYHTGPSGSTDPRPALKKTRIAGLEDRTIVFINGSISTEHSTMPPDVAGLTVCSLKSAIQTHAQLINKHIARYADYEDHAFTALNTAFFDDGIFIHVQQNHTEERPVHLIFLTDPQSKPYFAAPRNLVVAESGSGLQFIETHYAHGQGRYLNNWVTEVVVGENSTVDHMKIQQENMDAYHISTIQVDQEASSTYSIVTADLGGLLVRNNTNIVLNGENCETHLVGLYLTSGRQHVDNHTLIDHASPHCESNEIYKGILGGKSRGVFNGKVFVRVDAQKTNAFQSNKALLLTDDAKVYSKPELEIYADDVKCSHGATVGQLDDDALFYLRARGIPEEMATSMLHYAFAADVFNHINNEIAREHLDALVFERFEHL